MAFLWLVNGGDPNHLRYLGWSSKNSPSRTSWDLIVSQYSFLKLATIFSNQQQQVDGISISTSTDNSSLHVHIIYRYTHCSVYIYIFIYTLICTVWISIDTKQTLSPTPKNPGNSPRRSWFLFVSSKKTPKNQRGPRSTSTGLAKVRRSPVFAYLATEVRWGWVEGCAWSMKK